MPLHVPPHLDAQDWLKGHSQEQQVKDAIPLSLHIREKNIPAVYSKTIEVNNVQ